MPNKQKINRKQVGNLKKLKYLSYDKIQDFLQCSRRFEKKYIKKRPESLPQSETFELLIRRVLALTHSHLVKKKYNGPIQSRLIDVPNLFWEEVIKLKIKFVKKQFFEGMEIIRKYCKTHEFDASAVIGVAQKFELDLNGTKIEGVIDLITITHGPKGTVVTATAYDTSWAFPCNQEIVEDLQFAIVHYNLCMAFPEANAFVLRKENLRYGLTAAVTMPPEPQADIVEYIRVIARQIDGVQQFSPTLNSHCVMCSYRHSCKAFHDAVRGGMPRTPEAMAQKYLALREVVEGIKANLKEYVSQNGPVLAVNKELMLTTTETISYPLDGLYRAFLGHNIDLFPGVAFSATAVEELLKMYKKALKPQGKSPAEVEGLLRDIENRLKFLKIVKPSTKLVNRKVAIATRTKAANRAKSARKS